MHFSDIFDCYLSSARELVPEERLFFQTNFTENLIQDQGVIHEAPPPAIVDGLFHGRVSKIVCATLQTPHSLTLVMPKKVCHSGILLLKSESQAGLQYAILFSEYSLAALVSMVHDPIMQDFVGQVVLPG